MSDESYPLLREKILKCLDLSILPTVDEAGWGLTKGKELSVINTVEALLTFQELDAITSPSIQTNKKYIINFLKNRIIAELAKQNATIRYISYGAIGLHILGNNDLEDECIARIYSSAKQSGGWSFIESQTDPLLVPTYHALFALQQIGVSIDDKHYDWLLKQQRSDSLFSFYPTDIKPDFGPSALALYLLINSSYKDKTPVAKLADKLEQWVPLIFEKMSQPDVDWISQDPQSSFKIYGYGHALAALNLFHTNLHTLSLNKFIRAVATAFKEPKERHPFSLIPEKTWVPEFFELSLALKSIRLNYDPFEYLNSQQNEKNLEINSEIEAEKALIAQDSKTIEIKQKILDEWEKELIRQRRLFYDLSEVKNTVAEAVCSELKTELKTLLSEIKLRLFNYLLIVFGVLLILGYFIIRLIVSKGEMSFNVWDSVVTFAGLVLSIVGIMIPVLKKSQVVTQKSSE